MKIRVLLVVTSMGACTGCSNTPGFDSPDPGMRERAIVQSAGSNDPADYPKLVEKLDDDDINARMLAITVLQRRTGTTRGYDYAAPRAERAASVKEWQAWAEQYANKPSTARPSGSSQSNETTTENPG